MPVTPTMQIGLRNPTITGGPKRSHVAANSQPSA